MLIVLSVKRFLILEKQLENRFTVVIHGLS